METGTADARRFVLAGAALLLGGAIPVQLVTLSFGYAQYIRQARMGPATLAAAHQFAALYIPLIYLPAMVGLLGIVLYSRRRYVDLARRIVVGLGAGAAATLVLDAIRQMGVINGWLPGDTVVMFGKMATGSTSFLVFWPAGLLVHYLNGASFGLIVTFVLGRRRTNLSAALWATAGALMLELGMMLGPPMAPMTGPFGVRFAWPQMFLDTLVAHIFFGVALGLLVRHLLREEDRAWLVPFLRGTGGDQVSERQRGAARSA